MANTVSIVLLVIIVVVFTVLGTFMFTSTRSILVKQQESMLQTKTQAIVSEFDALFKEKGALVKQMSTNTLFRQYIETTASAADAASSTYAAETQATLAAIVKAEPSFADAWVGGWMEKASGFRMMVSYLHRTSISNLVHTTNLLSMQTDFISPIHTLILQQAMYLWVSFIPSKTTTTT